MHEYAVSQNVRKWAWLILALIASMISAGYTVLSRAYPGCSIHPMIESPSILGVFGVLTFLYDRWGWKWKVFGLRLSPITDYSGIWEGVIHSDYNGGTSVKCTLTISQNWHQIYCELKTDKSRSVSKSATIGIGIGENTGLTWQYVNKPHHDCKSDMQVHHGVATAQIDEQGGMICDYYNCGRERSTCGTIRLHKRTHGTENNSVNIDVKVATHEV